MSFISFSLRLIFERVRTDPGFIRYSIKLALVNNSGLMLFSILKQLPIWILFNEDKIAKVFKALPRSLAIDLI